ncbi:OmpH family outer membrane protein [Flagellimonas sp.]|uniref:OmpH family outer membrane protein n=1 Tax=Flagellimonas sp. TaxID=2058762 RepID=UPI003B511710
MKKGIVVFIIALTVIACQQNKIGYVDNVKLMDGYQEKIDVEAKFRTKAEALTKKRDSISQAFQLELQEFQTKAQKMSQKSAQEEYGLLQQRGQFVGQQLQQEEQLLQKNSQTEMDSLVSRVKNEIKAYGKANGYTYVLTGGDGGAVLYGDDAQNITDAVIKILNDKYKK